VSGTESVQIGNPIRLLCNVTGSGLKSRDISWYRGGSEVTSDERAGVVVTRQSSDGTWSTVVQLDISASGTRHAGQYTCRTVNRRLAASIFVQVSHDGTPAH